MVHILSYRRMGVDVCYPTTHHAARGTKRRSTLKLYYYRLYYTQVGSIIKQSAFRNALAHYFTEQKRVVWCPWWCKGRKLLYNFTNDQAFLRVICCFSVILKLSAIRLQLGTSEFFLINATKADLIYSLTCNINSNNLSMHEDFQRFRGNFFFVIFSVHYK